MTQIRDIIGPALRSVLATGRATWSQDVMLPLNRNGYPEETYWTYSFSPLYDDAGAVRGAHTEATDATERVIGARRLAVLNDLGGLAGRASSVAEACELITLALSRAEHDVPSAAAFLRQEEPADLTLSVVSPPGTDPDALRRGAAGWPVDEAMRTGQPVRVTDVRERFGDLPAGARGSPPAHAMVVPLTGEIGGPAIGAVVLAASAGRALDESCESFLTLVAQQIASVINSAVAYQVQQRRGEELAELDALLLYSCPGPLELTFPADLDQFAPVRASLRLWLSWCDLSVRAVQDVLVAAGEACANAFEHGSGRAADLPHGCCHGHRPVPDSYRQRPMEGLGARPGRYRRHGIPLMRALNGTEVLAVTGEIDMTNSDPFASTGYAVARWSRGTTPAARIPVWQVMHEPGALHSVSSCRYPQHDHSEHDHSWHGAAGHEAGSWPRRLPWPR